MMYALLCVVLTFITRYNITMQTFYFIFLLVYKCCVCTQIDFPFQVIIVNEEKKIDLKITMCSVKNHIYMSLRKSHGICPN